MAGARHLASRLPPADGTRRLKGRRRTAWGGGAAMMGRRWRSNKGTLCALLYPSSPLHCYTLQCACHSREPRSRATGWSPEAAALLLPPPAAGTRAVSKGVCVAAGSSFLGSRRSRRRYRSPSAGAMAAALTPELLQLIFSFLDDDDDRIAALGVCRTWHAAMAANPGVWPTVELWAHIPAALQADLGNVAEMGPAGLLWLDSCNCLSRNTLGRVAAVPPRTERVRLRGFEETVSGRGGAAFLLGTH